MFEAYSKMVQNLFKVKIEAVGEEKSNEENIIKIDESYYEIKTSNSKTLIQIKELLNEGNKIYEEQLLKQAKENFVNDLIRLKFDNLELMLNRSDMLQFDFYIARRAIIICLENMHNLFKNKNEMVLQKFKEDFYDVVLESLDDEDNIVSYIGEDKFLICKKEIDGENIFDTMEKLKIDIKNKLGLSCKIAVGDSYDMPGLEAMSYSYQDCQKYLDIGRKYLPEKSIYDFWEVGVYLIYVNIDAFQKKKLLKYTKDMLEYGEINRIDIKGFLEAFFKNKYSVAKAEIEAGIPKNKGRALIKKKKEITNLDPEKFEDAVKFYVSMKIWRK